MMMLASLIAVFCAPAFAYKNAGDWAKPELNEAEMLGILTDNFDNADMKAPITRGEMSEIAAISYEMLTGNEPIPIRTDYFSDTSDPLICAAHEIGIVDGYPDGTFQPDKLLTRQEFFMLVSNLFDGIPIETIIDTDYLKTFHDRGEVSDWAEEATQRVVGLGIVNGTLDENRKNIIAPMDNTSRQEAIIMFLRAFKNIEFYLATDFFTEDEKDKLEEIAKLEGATEEAMNLVSYALSKVGLPYVFGANGPNSFDCSSYTQHVFKKYGYSINRVAHDQFKNGVAVQKSNLRPGDMVFFANTYSSSNYITHVGIYIGDGKFVHAANSRRGVTIDAMSTSYYSSRYAGARRILK